MRRIKITKDTALDTITEFIQNMKDGKEYIFTLEEYSEDRSLEANNFMWSLIGKIARALKTSKIELYREYLKRYGVSFLVQIPKDKKAEILKKYKYCEEFELYYNENPETICMEVIIGSSEYSKKDFSELLDGVITEAKELGIDTDPEEVKQIMERYTSEYK